MSKQSSLHPLKAKVFAKGQALREAREIMDKIIDLKTKVEGIAVDAGMGYEELWYWLVEQLEINTLPEDEEVVPVEESEEEEETEEGAE